MRTTFIRVAAIISVFSLGILYGQTQQVAAISSSYPVTVPMIAGINFSVAGLTVSYPVGLAANMYIAGSQLSTDFQTFLTAYPNPQDPPEAILSTVLQAILNKYPQMT